MTAMVLKAVSSELIKKKNTGIHRPIGDVVAAVKINSLEQIMNDLRRVEDA